MSDSPVTLFDFVGGEETFRRLVESFYRGVAGDPVLRPMYPEDLNAAEERLFLFLIQFFGGPSRYDELRGHPRLRMRHFPFSIGERERDAWLTHMRAAVDEAAIPEPARQVMLEYFENTAHFLMNRTPDTKDP